MTEFEYFTHMCPNLNTWCNQFGEATGGIFRKFNLPYKVAFNSFR